jgi:septin family protein
LITEVAIENGQPVENDEAVKRFISDIENHYDDYLRLRNKVSRLKVQDALLHDIHFAA